MSSERLAIVKAGLEKLVRENAKAETIWYYLNENGCVLLGEEFFRMEHADGFNPSLVWLDYEIKGEKFRLHVEMDGTKAVQGLVTAELEPLIEDSK